MIVTTLGSALMVKSVTDAVSALLGGVTNALPLALIVGVTVRLVVPAVGIRTTVIVAFEPLATIVTLQVTRLPTGFGQLPPGDEFAEEKVKPDEGNAPTKMTLEAGSGPVLSKTNENVIWFPTVPGFGLTAEVESNANTLCEPILARNASCGPFRLAWKGG